MGRASARNPFVAGNAVKNRARTFKLVYTIADIRKEQMNLINFVNSELVNDVKRSTQQVASNVRNRFSEHWPPPGGRRATVLGAIDRRGAVSRLAGKITMGVGNINLLDSRTLISRLDAAHPEYHDAPWLSKKVRKKSGQASKTQASLWRVLERRSEKQSPFGPVSSRFLSFTTETSRSEEKFVNTKMVTRWSMRSSMSSGSSGTTGKRFWFLNDQREIYELDKRIMRYGVVNSVKRGLILCRFSGRSP